MVAVIVIAVLVGLLTVICAVFCIPADITVNLECYDRIKTRIRITWLFGLIHKELTRKKEFTARKKRKQKPGLGDVFRILRIHGFLRRIALLVKQVIKNIRIKELSAHFRIGLDDVADTGILFSILVPIIPLFNYYKDYSVRLEPSFADAVTFEGYFNGTVRFQPIRLLPPLSGLIFSREMLRVIKALLIFRRRTKK